MYKALIRAFVITAILTMSFYSTPAPAQKKKQPSLPPPIENLVKDGAQVRYLGVYQGLDGWIAIQNGQEQYFYVTRDGQAFVMGLLFDREGKMVTMKQVQQLQESSGASALDLVAGQVDLAKQAQEEAKPEAENIEDLQFKTPAEQLFAAVENSNWIPLGDKDAPVIYTFVDPQCPYCKSFINDLRENYLPNSAIQVRIIPVGFREDTRSQAAVLLAVPNPQARWYRHLDGDEEALPVTAGINDQGVQRNMAIMQNWKLNVTPLTVYKNSKGEVQIIQGRAKDLPKLVADLAG